MEAWQTLRCTSQSILTFFTVIVKVLLGKKSGITVNKETESYHDHPPEELINSEKIKQWESERYPSNQTSGHHQ